MTFGYFSRYRTFGYQSVKYWGEFHHSFVIVICLNLLKQFAPHISYVVTLTTNVYHARRQKLCCRRTARVEQFAGYFKTDHQLRS